MTSQSLQPVLPDYLTQAVTEATEALEEVSNIITASNELEENLEQVSQAVADAEAELGDQESSPHPQRYQLYATRSATRTVAHGAAMGRITRHCGGSAAGNTAYHRSL